MCVGFKGEWGFNIGGEEQRPGRGSQHRRQLFEHRYGITGYVEIAKAKRGRYTVLIRRVFGV